MREYKKKRKIQRQNESPEEKNLNLKKSKIIYINKKRRMKSQNDSPASRGQKLLKEKDNMGNGEPSERQT